MIEELERVRAYRADEPPPSQATVAAARDALLQLIHDERPGKSPTSAAREIPRFKRRSALPARSPVGRRVWRLRAAVAVAVGCVGIVIAGTLGSPTASSPPSATAAVLEQLARVAASQAWTGTPGPGQYLYTKSESLTEADTLGPGGRDCVVRLLQHREIWIAADGAGAIRETDNHGRFTSANDRAMCRLDHITNPDSQDSSGTDRFGPGGLSFPTKNWHALSTNPAKLLIQLRRLDGGPRTAGEDFVHIGDFLRESDTPPAIRATLYRAAKLIPGVRYLGPTRDLTGRVGLAVAFFRHGQPQSELVFDQRTAALLRENYFLAGKLTEWSVYLESKIVNSLPPGRNSR
jgi:hypothetical protein